MQLIHRLFREHPESVGESYLEHLSEASYFGVRMLVAGLACLVHAVLPCLFKTTGRSAISELHTKMLVKRATHREWAILRAVRSDLNVALLSFRGHQPVGVTWAL